MFIVTNKPFHSVNDIHHICFTLEDARSFVKMRQDYDKRLNIQIHQCSPISSSPTSGCIKCGKPTFGRYCADHHPYG